MFFILLLVWMGLYTAFNIDHHTHETQIVTKRTIDDKEKQVIINQKKKGCFRHYRKFKIVIIVILLIIYPVQITISYYRGKREFTFQNANYVLFGLVGITLFFIFLFIYYTCKLKISLSRRYEAPPKKNAPKIYGKKHLAKAHIKNNKNISTNELKNFVKQVEEKNILHLIVRYIVDPNSTNKLNDGDDSDSELDYEDEMRDIDLKAFGPPDQEANPQQREEQENDDSSSCDSIDENENLNESANKDIKVNVNGNIFNVKEIKKEVKFNNGDVNENKNTINLNNLNNPSNTVEHSYKKKEKQRGKRKYDYLLTKNDMNVLNKVC
jgi:hypothetical protein